MKHNGYLKKNPSKKIGKLFSLSLLLLCSAPLVSCQPSETQSETDHRLIYDLSQVSFEDASFPYDGKEHQILLQGTLPSGVRVTYTGNGKTKVGTYLVTAHFEGDDSQYQPLPDLTATLTITPWILSDLEFPSLQKEYDGSYQSLTLASSLPDGVLVSYQGGGVDVGSYPVTAYLQDTTGNYQVPSSLTATLVITRKKIEPPKVKTSSFTYDGEEHTVVLEGFDSDTMVLSGDRKATEKGQYSLQVSLKDEKNMAWSDASFSGTLTWEITDHSDEVSFLVQDGKAWILGFSPNQNVTRLVIPDTVYSNGCSYPVTGVNQNAFYQNDQIEEVILPDSLLFLGDNAFKECTSLKTVRFGSGLKNMGGNCFSGDTSLETVSLPHGVQEVGWCAFFGCTSVSSVSFPDTLKKVGARAFAGCTSITSFEVSSTDSLSQIAFGSDDANPLYFSHQFMVNGAVITDLDQLSCSQIASYAFCGWEITSLTLPSFLVSVGSGAFAHCTSLTEVKVTDLSSFSQISFADKDANPLSLAHTLTRNGVTVDSLDLNASVTEIGRYAFSGWDISSLVIPDTVIRIGFGSFSDCDSLTSVSFGSGVQEIGDQAFFGDDGLTLLVCPPSLQCIGQRAFYHCDSLAQVSFNSTLISLGERAFAKDISLSSLVFPSSLKSIGAFCFEQCSSLSSVTLDDALSEVGNGAFDGCLLLSEVHVSSPYLLNSIRFGTEGISNPLGNGASLYQGTETVTSLSFEGYQGSILDCAYDGMNSLSSVSFGTGVTGIGHASFRRTGLTSLSLSSSITTIGNQAFSECRSLQSVQETEGLVTISESAFERCEQLSSVSFPSSLTTISKQAFYLCTKLQQIDLGNQVNFIGESAFGFCDNLKTVSLPDSLVQIGKQAFEFDGKLTEVDLGQGVRSLGDGAFLECDDLTALVLPKSVSYFGKEVFSGCRSLTALTYLGSQNEFLQIQKDRDWKEGSALTSVICQDGILFLS